MRYSMRLLARQRQRPADSAQPMPAIESIPPPRRRPAEPNATHDPIQSETPPAARKKDRFMTAPSPGIVATTMLNQHYDIHEAYPMALAKALSHEYRAIRDIGPILQIDSPDPAMERHRFFDRLDEAAFLRLHATASVRTSAGATTTGRMSTTSRWRPSCRQFTRPISPLCRAFGTGGDAVGRGGVRGRRPRARHRRHRLRLWHLRRPRIRGGGDRLGEAPPSPRARASPRAASGTGPDD